MSRRTGIALALAAVGPLALFWLTGVPLGVPGEWTWSRMAVEAGDGLPLLLGVVLAAAAGIAYFAFVALGASRLERGTAGEAGLWLAGLCGASFAWLWVLQESPPHVESELAKSAWVLYYPASEGYYERARQEAASLRSYLTTYERQMARGDVLHFGTHPPGLIVLHHWSIDLCATSPALRSLLLRTQPASFRSAFEVIEETERGTPRAPTDVDRAAIWLAVLFTQAVAAATVIPLYGLARRTVSATASWWTAALWPLVPALGIFLPKSDALFPFLACLFLWCWLKGIDRRSPTLCFVAGLVFWAAMFLSLAILPVALAAALLTAWDVFISPSDERVPLRGRDWAACLAAVLAGWLLPVILFLADSLNLVSIWSWNYRNHAAFYSQYSRTYWKWLLVNPLELCLAAGLPLMVAAAWGLREGIANGWRRRAMGPYWCLAATWLVLWISGKNEGEAARLWLVILPWPVWLCSEFIEGHLRRKPAGKRAVWALFAAQLVIAIGTVTRITGFELPVPVAAVERQTLPIAVEVTNQSASALRSLPAALARTDESSPESR